MHLGPIKLLYYYSNPAKTSPNEVQSVPMRVLGKLGMHWDHWGLILDYSTSTKNQQKVCIWVQLNYFTTTVGAN